MIMGIVKSFTPDYDLYHTSPLAAEMGPRDRLLFGPTPLTTDQTQIMELLKTRIAVTNGWTMDETNNYFLPFSNSTVMDGFFANNSKSVIGAVWFNGTYPATAANPFQYSIRLDADEVSRTDKTFGGSSDDSLKYIKDSFETIQVAMDEAIMNFYGLNNTITMTSKRYPNPFTAGWQAWNEGRDSIFKNAGGVFISAALLMFAFRLVTDLVMEKETKIREGMKMMGMMDLPYFLSWLITSLIICIPVTLMIAAIVKGSMVVYHTSWLDIIFVYLLYTLTLVLLGFIASVFFDHSKFAGILVFFGLLVISVIGIFIAKANMSKYVKLLLSLMSPVGLACANYHMAVQDLTDLDPMPANTTTSKDIIGLMCVDIVLYTLLYWYLNNVIAGEFGTAKPWNFLFKSSYWFPTKDHELIDVESYGSNEDVEGIPLDLKRAATVSIRNLRKEFYTGDGVRVAVDGLSLDMYPDQIHAFLGHNGAGKSTTIGMLTGLLPPTDGDAFVQGYSIQRQMNSVRRTLGVCPQHDIIWKELTVLEHFKIYAALKGVRGKDIAVQADKMCDEVGLGEKKNAPSGTLSGGQKRKLCLGIAFIGRSEVIFLDEVTSGMDPLSRRGVWDFLLKYKQGRTIILTTHFMDEADFLGDRIAIISHGKLRCDGSSLFLKKKFGIGYLLTMAKIANSCNTEGVTNFIHQYIPEAVVLSDAGTELSFRLPTSSVDQFVPFFMELDQQKAYLGIGNYGISVTTMEEVFLRIGQESQGGQFSLTANQNRNEEVIKKAISTSTTGTTWRQQMKGLIIKRLITSYKDLKTFLLTVFLPIILIACSIVIYKKMRIEADYFNNITTPLTFSMSTFGPDNKVYVNTIDGNLAGLSASPFASQLQSMPVGTNLEDYLKTHYNSSAGSLNFTSEVAAQQLEYNVYFNKGSLHSIPTHVNLVHDALLRQHNGIGIATTNAPFAHVLTAIEAAVSSVDMNAVVYFNMLFIAGYGLMVASFAANMCVERVTNIKRLLYISGCKKHIYWLANLFWDYTLSIPVVFIVSGVLAGVETKYADQFGIILIGQILFCLGCIPLSYLLSYRYNTHGKAIGAIFGIQYGIALVMIIASINMRIQMVINQSEGLQLACDIVDYVFYIVSPLYALGRIMVMCVNFPGTMRLGQWTITNYWDVKITGAPLLFLVGHAIVWTTLILVLDYFPEIRGRMKNPKNTASPQPPADEDTDVAAERMRLGGHHATDDVLVMRDLHKLFPAKGKHPDKIAVHNTTLGIPRGQTFGLLGMNGAGKTTTLSMLSGDISPTAGSATINGFDLISQRSNALHSIGSCPQFDALIPLLSGREQLYLYCRIKGIPEDLIPTTVEAFITMMDLEGLANTNVGGYSGGNKRKLSLSVAMIGNPSVVFLDEPSTGCDPQVRRFMWNVISELGANKVIIITTHSMEECEALCQRISIMKDGKFTCLGSNQHIKSKFGSGYSLDFKIKKEYLDTAADIIGRTFPGIELLDSHDLILNFELPSKYSGHSVKVSEIFNVIQQQLHFLVEDYSVSQTSLEQVFLKLTSATYEARLNQLSESQQNAQIPL
ncbi:hypothetical protein SAMD00019534_056050 [Acytostelium subglobosum LB1]|uniref:hypothetical protein n=1 Tax=Acytostelium subglobosum LB1 TaxID=1410327 RepID=UPI0006451D60|nr:hypothetical protein SAMD00019534_056050 [Acytostelium subglobosum LB1]GAM22430.1 hypothetical protein SAMD00019534_056050 [Acytostelium subglobosum LB1]|eukprot:XP_012754550.1 hypothetical protein SAMD00019534_056050 [Acytostelium subglobosum LB1]